MIHPRIAPRAPVIVLGVATPQAQRYIRPMRDYGTNIVAGVAPGGKADGIEDLPIFPSCAEAVAATQAEACVEVARPEFTADAVLEAAESGIRLIVSVGGGMPVHDSMRIMRRIHELGTTWIGPSSPGVAIPADKIKLGWIPDAALEPGRYGLMSRSDTLSFQVGSRMRACGLGQSVWVGVGGELVEGTRLPDLLPFFAEDEETAAVIAIGEAGGTEELELAGAMEAQRFAKPVFALLAGSALPQGVLASPDSFPDGQRASSVEAKAAALERAGAKVYNSIGDLIEALRTAC